MHNVIKIFLGFIFLHFIVGINIVFSQVAICKDATIFLNSEGTYVLSPSEVDNGSIYPGGTLYVIPENFNCTHVGSNSVQLFATDSEGVLNVCEATVEVLDTIAPQALCKNVTLALDADGVGVLDPSDIDDESSDVCGISLISLNKTNFDCSDVGNNMVILTVVDNSNNASTCEASVTILDNVNPVAICKEGTLALGPDGVGILDPLEMDGGSSDACGISSFSLSRTTFGCSDIGTNPIILTVQDSNGNISTCNSFLNVVLGSSPMVVCRDTTLSLNTLGVATINPAQLDGGSSDICEGDLTYSLSKSNFDCSDIGSNTVVLTVSNVSGISETCSANVLIREVSIAFADNAKTRFGLCMPNYTFQVFSSDSIYQNSIAFSGPGILNSSTGVFDPSLAGIGEHTITVNALVNGCLASANILVEVTPLQLELLPFCTCSNDSEVNQLNGTYKSTLRIKGEEALPPDRTFRVFLAGGLFLEDGNLLPSNTAFRYCNGMDCPFGVEDGEYYLEVFTQDGSSQNFIEVSETCSNTILTNSSIGCSGYPSLPQMPSVFNDSLVCMESNLIVSRNGGYYSLNSDPEADPELPPGFVQSGNQLQVSKDSITNITINLYLHKRVVNSSNGFVDTCYSSSVRELTFLKRPILKSEHFACIDTSSNSTLFLNNLLEAFSDDVGNYFINGDLIENGEFIPHVPGCYSLTYDPNVCGFSPINTNFLVTFSPQPKFNLISSSPSPVCSPGDSVQITIQRLSTGFSPKITINSGDGGPVARIIGNINSGNITVVLPAPLAQGGFNYIICLEESGFVPTSDCGDVEASGFEACLGQSCKSFTVYNDGFSCGADAIFSNQCILSPPTDLCPTFTKPSLDFSCRWFTIRGPRIITSSVRGRNAAYNCKDERVEAVYSLNLPGALGNAVANGPKVGSLPGLNVVCGILNWRLRLSFKVFGKRFTLIDIKPFGNLGDGCNRTIGQIILDALSRLIGGDGGGGFIAGDSRGFGNFDVIEEIPFGISNRIFSIPNRIQGTGHIGFRVAGGWPFKASSLCGDIVPQQILLLDLLPIGAIPIVGGPVEDLLAAAGCNIDMTFSSVSDVLVPIFDNSPPQFFNCNPDGYTFYTTTGCETPVDWAIPSAFEDCRVVALEYKGYFAGGLGIAEPGIYQVMGEQPGAILSPGSYPVTYWAVGCSGNLTSCSFTVTVSIEEPILKTPNNLTFANDINSCTRVVNGLSPSQGLGCLTTLNYRYISPVSQTLRETNSTIPGDHNIPDGHIFEKGTTQILYTLTSDINGNGIIEADEIQTRTFSVTISDQERPVAQCLDVEVTLNNQGIATVFAQQNTNNTFVNGGCTDNCDSNLLLLISRDGSNFTPSLNFTCRDIGNNLITLRAMDADGNFSDCLARVKVNSYFEPFQLNLNIPTICLGPFQESFDLKNYVTIDLPNGNSITHHQISSLGSLVFGEFMILGFTPDFGEEYDEGIIEEGGLLIPGNSKGYLRIGYAIAIDGESQETSFGVEGCYKLTSQVVRIETFEPEWEGGYICCDSPPVWLGGASDFIPQGYISLEDLGGSYPNDTKGSWTGQGVSFMDPDGIPYSGDEFFFFDPSGLEGNFSLNYSLSGEACNSIHSSTMRVTCQPLQFEVSSITVCPNSQVAEIEILTNLSDYNLIVSTEGMNAVGGIDLIEQPVINGRVVIPSFLSIMTADEIFSIKVSVNQSNNFGCSDEFEFSIRIQDLEPPTFINCSEGVEFTVSLFPSICEGGTVWSIPVPIDNCGIDFYEQTAGPAQDSVLSVGFYEIEYTAIDFVGNISTCTFYIEVIDTEDPIVVCPGNVVINATDFGQCEWTSPIGSLSPLLAASNCPATITWEVLNPDGTIESGSNDVSGYTFSLGESRVTYTITENASLQNWSCSFTVSIFDKEAPVLFCPADLVLECANSENDQLIADWLQTFTATDNCDQEVTLVSSIFSINSKCGNTETLLYKVVATDFSGNSTECFRSVVVLDTTAPLITEPARDFTVQCDGSNNAADILNWLNNNGFAQATDACGNINWSNNYGQLSVDCGFTGGVEVTFFVEDDCGNVSSTTSIFSIIDTLAPEWVKLPLDLLIECDGTVDPYDQINFWLNNVGGGYAQDDCSLVTYANNFSILQQDCGTFTGSAEVEFVATDACGNRISSTANVLVIDNSAPIITTQARDTIVECDGLGNTSDLENWLNNNGGAIATDLCSEPLEWFNERISTLLNCGGTLSHKYRFYALDACGNRSINSEADFIILDRTSPSLIEEAKDRVVECDGVGNLEQLNLWIENNGGANVEDICSDYVWTYNLVNSLEECNGTRTQRFVFTATDLCGNFVTTEANFVIIDTSPPVIAGGSDLLMEECLVPPVGNFPEFLFWLESQAGAEAEDICGDFVWTNDYHPDHWVQLCGNTRYIDVTFTATDPCGNASSILHRFSIGDTSAPAFLNCPRLPIIVDAPMGWCSAFVNFSPPAAEDNCSKVTINQIDTTGLNSGSLFPVGLSILIFEAVDECGNRDTCQYKIIVNDYLLPPDFTCPDNVKVTTDAGLCSANVSGLSIKGLEDNCMDNVSVIFRVENAFSDITGCGIENASGFVFSQGYNKIVYEVRDQPILLITQIVHDAQDSRVEITNFGPAAFDITCLEINRLGAMEEVYLAPPNTLLLPGESYVQIFAPLSDLDSPVSYTIGFLDYLMDGVAINSMMPTQFNWSGVLLGSQFSRVRICDTDSAEDWRRHDDCFVSLPGEINSYLQPYIFPWNGSKTTLQSRAPSYRECEIVVEVDDQEAPLCSDLVINSYEGQGVSLLPQNCNISTIEVAQDFQLSRVRIDQLIGSFTPLFDLSVKLVSPMGTEVVLFDNICGNSSDFSIGFSDDSLESLENVPCAPAGNGKTFQPLQPLKILSGERSLGTWRIEMYSNSDNVGQLAGWQLVLEELLPYSQGDVVLENEVGKCGARFDWLHPYFSDNCCEGSIRVDYSSLQNISVPMGKTLTGRGGYEESEFFAVGETLVSYSLIDQFGNESSCTFSVVVLDIELPTISSLGCRNHVIYLQPTECTAKFDYPALMEMDNCEILSVDYNPPPGYDFPIGENLVEVVVTDFSGNKVECDFTITVVESIPSTIQMFCNSEINLSLGPDCLAEINADLLLEGSNYRCYENYCITLKDAIGNILGSSEQGNASVGIDQVGSTVLAEICSCKDAIVLCCTVSINIQAFSIPKVVCPEDITLACNGDISPENTGIPILENCVPSVQIDYFDVFVNNGTCGSPRAVFERNWIVTNDFGDKITCLQYITFDEFSGNNIEFPENLVFDLSLDCEEVINNISLLHPSNTGFPTLEGQSLIGAHLCEFNVGYWDEVLQDANCEGSFEVLRHWTVRNECQPLSLGINPIRHIQAIKVNDKSGPVFLANFDDITLTTQSFSCTADYFLGNLDELFLDACSSLDNFTIIASGCQILKGKDNSFTLKNLKKGIHPIRILARDNCWNVTEESFTITVVDRIPPVAICISELSVSLGSDGLGYLQAYNLDKGSYDNCGAVKFEIRRENNTCNRQEDLEFGASVQFCCSDLGMEPVSVILRVWDDADGNGVYGSTGDFYTECTVFVNVNSLLPPQIECAEDLWVGCETDLDSLALLFSPIVLEGCPNTELVYEDDYFIDHCGIGRIVRNWTVKGYPQVACSQVIDISAPKPFDPLTDIIWPSDWVGDCLDFLPYSEPIVNKGVCQSVLVSKKDQIYHQVDSYCYIILREWTVLDACLYDPSVSDTLGKYTYEQIIRIADETGPSILNCDDFVIPLEGQQCQLGSIFISQSSIDFSCGINDELTWAYRFFLENTMIPHQVGQGKGLEISAEIINVPLGIHLVEWQATDGCGNITTCLQKVEVKDNIPPSPICRSGIIAIPMRSGLVTLQAEDFNLGSFDNCTPSSQLIYSFSESDIVSQWNINCDDLMNGITQSFTIPIWVWDSNGNKDYCTVLVVVQDNDDTCNDIEDMIRRVDISGSLRNTSNLSIADAVVELKSYLPDFPLFLQSDDLGGFSFSQIQSPAFYLLSAKKENDPLNGVSTLDLVLLQRYLLGSYTINSSYKLIAADINNDERISGVDIGDLRNLILMKTSVFPNNNSWRFVDKNYVFANPLSPWPFDEEIIVYIDDQDSVSSIETQLIGIKIGDLNGNAGSSFVEERSSEDLTLFIEDIELEKEEYYTLNIFGLTSNKLSGMQFTLHLNGIELLEVDPRRIDMNAQNYHLLPNGVSTWSFHSFEPIAVDRQNPLFAIKIKANRSGKLSEIINLSSIYTPAEAYFGEELLVGKVKLDFEKMASTNEEYRLYQNEPNPFTFETKIQFEIPSNEFCELRVFDFTGQEIIRSQIQGSKGLNEFVLDRNRLGGVGIYYYNLECGDFSSTKKMIVID